MADKAYESIDGIFETFKKDVDSKLNGSKKTGQVTKKWDFCYENDNFIVQLVQKNVVSIIIIYNKVCSLDDSLISYSKCT